MNFFDKRKKDGGVREFYLLGMKVFSFKKKEQGKTDAPCFAITELFQAYSEFINKNTDTNQDIHSAENISIKQSAKQEIDTVQDSASALAFLSLLIRINEQAPKTEVWFDHLLGGGTESYTKQFFTEHKNDCLFIRLQNKEYAHFVLSFFYKDYAQQIFVKNYAEVEFLLKKLRVRTIVVNNLVGYRNYEASLNAIAYSKDNLGAQLRLNVHDYQAICPAYHLTRQRGVYCQADFENCPNCFAKNNSVGIPCSDIRDWQKMWGEFLEKSLDEIVVFSRSSQELLLKKYPSIKEKISVIPHVSAPLRPIQEKIYNKITIGVIGTIGINKGACIIQSMLDELQNQEAVTIKIIGEFKAKGKSPYTSGKYKREHLPDILEREEIDLIFISSVVPETFSFTTDEAMMMNMPVACFDLGAPPERVRGYAKGLVLESMDAKKALKQMIVFIQGLREDKEI